MDVPMGALPQISSNVVLTPATQMRYYTIALLVFDVTQIHVFSIPGVPNDDLCAHPSHQSTTSLIPPKLCRNGLHNTSDGRYQSLVCRDHTATAALRVVQLLEKGACQDLQQSSSRLNIACLYRSLSLMGPSSSSPFSSFSTYWCTTLWDDARLSQTPSIYRSPVALRYILA